MTAEEVVDAISKMENDEWWKRLEELCYLHYNKDGIPMGVIDY